MSNTQQQVNQVQTQEISFKDVKNVGLGTVVSALNAVNNTARLVEHTTGILADKAERYREQISISDAITHNQLMAQYKKEAADYGIDI